MLYGDAADEFGDRFGVEQVDPSWLVTDLRHAQWTKWKAQRLRPGATDEEDALLDHDAEEGWGTVGAVALDKEGNLAAATSTGGMTGNRSAGLAIPLSSVPALGQTVMSPCPAPVWVKRSFEPLQRTKRLFFVGKCTSSKRRNRSCKKWNRSGSRWPDRVVRRGNNVVVPFQTMLMYRGIYRDGVVSLGIGPEMID